MLSPVHLSVCGLSVYLSVTFVRRTQLNFRQVFYAVWYPGHPLTFTENLTVIVPGEPLRQGGGLKHEG